MEKATAIIEILVIGLVAVLGLTLNTIGIMQLDINYILMVAEKSKDHSNLILAIIFAISYQLGWLINLMHIIFLNPYTHI